MMDSTALPPRGAAWIVQKAQQRGVPAVELWSVDLVGRPVAVTVPLAGLEAALEDGLTTSGALVRRKDSEDVVLVADPQTFVVLPPAGARPAIGRLVADLQALSGAPSPWCSRTVLKRQIGRANGLGYTFYIGATIELHWLAAPGDARPAPAGAAERLALSAAAALEEVGVAVRAIQPGRGADGSHWAFDLDWVDPLTLADSLVTFRRVVRDVARAGGHEVTFMPHPWNEAARSRLDLYVSLVEGGTSSYADALEPGGLSPAARVFSAWLASEVPALELVFKGTVNSYAVPDVPRVVTSALGRGEGGAAVQVRGPDSAANPYLTLALVLGVGLAAAQGGPPTQRASGASTLREAARAAEASAAVRDILGAELLELLVSNAHNESHMWRREVTPWEVGRYLAL